MICKRRQNNMVEVTDATGPGILQDGKFILMFYTGWCPRCPPVIEALAEIEERHRNQFTFAKIDYDKNPEAREFFGISGVPAIVSVRDGAVRKIWIGIGGAGICEEAAADLLKET
jgi:thiol-disulfide isomerase/thioredoxin